MDYKKIVAIDYNDEYAFGEQVNFMIPELKSRIKPKINQSLHKDTKNSCTIAGSLIQIIRLFGIELTSDDSNELLLEVAKRCAKYQGYVLGDGRSTPRAVNSVVKRWNEIGYERFNKEKVFYVRLDHKSPFIQEALDKGHYVGFTFKASRGRDRADGVVDGTEFDFISGHRTNNQPLEEVNNKYSDGEGCERGVYDSYYPRDTNEYYIRHYQKMANMGKYIYSPNYLILPESAIIDTVEEEKRKIAEMKSYNALVGLLSSTEKFVDEETQEIVKNFALVLMRKNRDIRLNIGKNVELQAFVDSLSFFWRFLEEDDQITIAKLAKKLRAKYDLL